MFYTIKTITHYQEHAALEPGSAKGFVYFRGKWGNLLGHYLKY